MDNLALEGRAELASQIVRAAAKQSRPLGGVVGDPLGGHDRPGRVDRGLTVIPG